MASDVPPHVELELQSYFRNAIGNLTCVVTARSDYTWHHLNHDHGDHRLSNIVPLLHRLNINLFHAKNDWHRLYPELEPQSLKSNADTAFWQEGQVARAFGCLRIAYYVAQYKEESFSEQLHWAGHALYYARHKPNYRVLEELVRETILEPLEQHQEPIRPDVMRDLLQEFEALLTLGGETKKAAALSEYSRSLAPPQDTIRHAGAIRRAAHSLGTRKGPTQEVLSRLEESASLAPKDVNQILNVASTLNSLHLGEDTKADYQKAFEIASERYEEYLASLLDVHDGIPRPKSRIWELPTLPIRASPANLAHLNLVRAFGLAFHKPGRWRESLEQAIPVTEYYWNLAGAKIDGPGRGEWKQIIASLDATDPLQRKLIDLIAKLIAPPFPPALTKSIYRAAKKLAERHS